MASHRQQIVSSVDVIKLLLPSPLVFWANLWLFSVSTILFAAFLNDDSFIWMVASLRYDLSIKCPHSFPILRSLLSASLQLMPMAGYCSSVAFQLNSDGLPMHTCLLPEFWEIDFVVVVWDNRIYLFMYLPLYSSCPPPCTIDDCGSPHG